MSSRFLLFFLLSVASILASCSGGGSTSPSNLLIIPTLTPISSPTPTPIATINPLAIIAPINQWTWVDFFNANCDDGSTTGIGINIGTGPDIVFYFAGGGACWDSDTCLNKNLAVHGPFGAAQFGNPNWSGTIFDRSISNNPFKTATLVFIPYCTGDIFTGNNIASYSTNNGTYLYHHVGHNNIIAYLQRLVATIPSPHKVIVTGASAGGYGSLFNFDTIQKAWPKSIGYLIDDSGPPFENGIIPTYLYNAFITNWHLNDLLSMLCTNCNGFSGVVSTLSQRYPQDRFALLSWDQDPVISSYASISTSEFKVDIMKLYKDYYSPTNNAKYYLLQGTRHTMILDTPTLNNGLMNWINQEVSDSPLWSTYIQ